MCPPPVVPCEEDPSCGADTDDLTPANLTDPVVTIEVYGSSPEPTSTGQLCMCVHVPASLTPNCSTFVLVQLHFCVASKTMVCVCTLRRSLCRYIYLSLLIV